MKPPPPGRFLALDGLRGIAALSVLVFHMFWNSAGSEDLRDWLPEFVTVSTGVFRSGVAIFFVISGFVIAHTTLSMRSPRQGARFALRRQVRLDPPYYVALALVIAIEVAQSTVPGLEARSFTPLDVLVNMLYLQDILGFPSILPVAWTLCLEVQFYLVVVILAIAATAIGRTERSRLLLSVGGATLLAVVSLSLPLLGVSSGPWVIGLWWMFGIGMTLAWYADGVVPGRFVLIAFTILIAWACALTLFARSDRWGGEWAAIGTGIFIAILVARRGLARSPGRVMLHMGRLSYSLYLVHLPVIVVVAGAGDKLFPNQPPWQFAFALIAGAASIGVAEVLYRWVETPAIRWSKALKRPSAQPVPNDGLSSPAL